MRRLTKLQVSHDYHISSILQEFLHFFLKPNSFHVMGVYNGTLIKNISNDLILVSNFTMECQREHKELSRNIFLFNYPYYSGYRTYISLYYLFNIMSFLKISHFIFNFLLSYFFINFHTCYLFT